MKVYFKEWRLHRKMSLRHVADMVGTSFATVQKIETGKRHWLDSYLFKFAMAMDCLPQELFSPPPLNFYIAYRSEDAEIVETIARWCRDHHEISQSWRIRLPDSQSQA
jgi:transcriptional regulator with XRE-family HTH domain